MQLKVLHKKIEYSKQDRNQMQRKSTALTNRIKKEFQIMCQRIVSTDQLKKQVIDEVDRLIWRMSGSLFNCDGALNLYIWQFL